MPDTNIFPELPNGDINPKAGITRVILAVNVVLFVMMVVTSEWMSLLAPPVSTLIEWGGNSGASTVVDGQYWRIVSGAFLHIGLLHLAMNMYFLWSMGPMIEQLFGQKRTFVIYMLSAIGGSLFSLLLNPTVISAGASGALLGLFGAMTAFFWRTRRYTSPGLLKRRLIFTVIFVVYCFGFGLVNKHIDNGAHLGGLLTGFLAGLALLPRFEETRVEKLNRIIFSIAAASLPVILFAANVPSIAKNPHVLAMHEYQKACILSDHDKKDEALNALNEALKYDPELKVAVADRAELNVTLKHFADALQDVTVLLKTQPDNKEALLLRSAAYHGTGQYQRAVDDLSKMIADRPNEAIFYNNRAWSYIAMGKLDEADTDVNKAITLDRKLSTAYDTRAVVEMRSGKYPEAVADLSKAMEIKNDDGAYYFHRYIASKHLGKSSEAQADEAKWKKLTYQPEPWESGL